MKYKVCGQQQLRFLFLICAWNRVTHQHTVHNPGFLCFFNGFLSYNALANGHRLLKLRLLNPSTVAAMVSMRWLDIPSMESPPTPPFFSALICVMPVSHVKQRGKWLDPLICFDIFLFSFHIQTAILSWGTLRSSPFIPSSTARMASVNWPASPAESWCRKAACVTFCTAARPASASPRRCRSRWMSVGSLRLRSFSTRRAVRPVSPRSCCGKVPPALMLCVYSFKKDPSSGAYWTLCP